jgi:HSP20 family molecular chaperone IbpA
MDTRFYTLGNTQDIIDIYVSSIGKAYKTDGENYIITHDIPGVKFEDVSLVIEDGVLILNAKRYDDGRTYKKMYVLPRDVNVDAINAVLQYGIITITLKKIKKDIVSIPVKVL